MLSSGGLLDTCVEKRLHPAQVLVVYTISNWLPWQEGGAYVDVTMATTSTGGSSRVDFLPCVSLMSCWPFLLA